MFESSGNGRYYLYNKYTGRKISLPPPTHIAQQNWLS